MMKEYSPKILFLHELDSSKESINFHTIACEKKVCITVDYRNLSYASVEQLYHDSITTIQPNLLVGHSLGAYWALKMSAIHKIPAVIANPDLRPNFRDDYPALDYTTLDHEVPQIAYLELGDEILDMPYTQKVLEKFMQVKAVEGGHHHLANPNNLNLLIQYLENYFLSVTSAQASH